MAHVEPMDLDDIESDFDNKENTFHINNALPRAPCFEKVHENLDVSEVKHICSITQGTSSMSKSYTANIDDKNILAVEDHRIVNSNSNLTQSLNSTLANCNGLIKSPKSLPLQSITTSQCTDLERNTIDKGSFDGKNNINLNIDGSDMESLSLPSTSSSLGHTPEATTPTKEIPKDGGSPIMRGLKSVLSIFRSSQSPIPPLQDRDDENKDPQEAELNLQTVDSKPQMGTVLASTPMKNLKRNCTLKESVTFNDDLDRELEWKEDSAVFFKEEKVPLHILFPTHISSNIKLAASNIVQDDRNISLEYMDISLNETITANNIKEIEERDASYVINNYESDSALKDCETTLNSSEADHNHENESISAKTYNTINKDPNLDMSGLGLKNMEVVSSVTKSKLQEKSDFALNSAVVIKMDIGSEVTDSFKEDAISLDSKPISYVTNESMNIDGIAEKRVQNTELEKVAIKLNESVDIETYLDGLGTKIIENINNQPIVESECLNIDNKPMKLNKTIDLGSHLDSENILESKTTEKLHTKSYSVKETLEPTLKTSIDNEEEISNRTIDIVTHTENLLSSETIEKKLAMSNIDNEDFNKTLSYNEDILNINSTINIGSGVSNNQAITTEIKTNNDNNQVHITEACVDQEIYTEFNNDFENKNTVNLDFITEIDYEVSENNYNKSVLPDVVQSNENPEFLLKGEGIVKSEIEIVNKSDVDCMNSDKLENPTSIQVSTAAIESGMLHDNCPIFQEKNIEDIHNDIGDVQDNINKNDSKNIDILQLIQATGSTEMCNNTFDSQNIDKDVNEDNIAEPVIVSIENNESLTNNENNVSKYQDYNCSQKYPISISEPFYEAKNIISDNNNFTNESVCLQPDILNENQILGFEGSLKKSIHTPQEDFVDNTCHTEVEQATLSKKKLESFTHNEKCEMQFENETLNSTENVANDENIFLNKLSLPVTEDLTEENFVMDLKNDLNVEINVIKALDSNLTISNECDIINEESFEINSETQESLCQTQKLDQDDLEVENINNSQSTGTVVRDNPFKTKSEQLEIPPTSPKIESKGYNFNFDEINDPFATKTMIRASPPQTNSATDTFTPIETLNKTNSRQNLLQNKRKLQPLPKKLNVGCKENTNSSLNEAVSSVKENNINLNKTQSIETVQSKDKVLNQTEILNIANSSNIDAHVEIANNSEIDNVVINEHKRRDLNISYDVSERNVFNLPEIDDRNFNPFTTRTKVCLTPPLVNDTFTADNTELLESNKNNATVIVNNDDTKAIPEDLNYIGQSRHEDETLKEVNTEDEDTIEGPFLEEDNLGEIEKGENLLSDDEHDYNMAFDDLPKQQTDEAENEMFIDAEAFEFLLNQNQANIVADSGKESLFLKFDPLFAKRVSSDGALAALSYFQKKQSTPKKEKQPEENYLYAETTNVFPSCSKNVPTFDNIDESIVNNVSKPTMVVNPAVASPRKNATPPKRNRQSLTFTSPAMAVIDKLLSLSGNTSTSLCHDTSIPQSCSEQQHTDIALTQLREMLAEKEMHVQLLRNDRKELTDRLGALESQVKALEYESEDRLKRIKELNNELSEKNKQNKNMATVVEQYERTIATLVAELELSKKQHAEERTRLIKDRNEQTAHLSTLEISFNDLHSKYEKSKQIILSLKANEDCLKKSLQEFEDNQLKIQNNYELLKQHATGKLNHANQELEKLNTGHEAEVLKLQAMIKRKDLHISSLEETLAQKTKVNKELTAICDELINKVG
ncbi:MATH and LRR domain-containing protein PFE0570w-like [Pieris rapae]|uniref:MATH and LRR domain-containing protein PFE0570w-like n=1 Tax=Pieris rapae TaxID=64459 RepID=UPI001E27F817|nr:MATH and LRR domain-containing protein PFE0570w-like [Pieris rapae]